MKLKSLYLTKNACYKFGQRMTVRGIMLHSTGANNPYLKRYVGPDDGLLGVNRYGNHWNTYKPGGQNVCVHAFIGKLQDGSIATYQTLPWNMKGWHSGRGSRGSANNLGYIGFEICEDDLKDAGYLRQVYTEAVDLVAFLCEKFSLDPLKDGVVICHSEGHARGIASNHGDVMHWWPRHGLSMDAFREAVAAKLGSSASSDDPTDYRVRVTASALNIRKGPGTGCAVTGSIRDKGIYTIVAEADGIGAAKWGKLKSGAGWISLDYTTKL